MAGTKIVGYTVILLLILSIIAIWVSCAHAVEIDMAAIMTIESSGRSWIVADDGGIGLFQIMPCVLSEYNQFNRTKLIRADLLSPKINYKVASWYITSRIPQMLSAYNRPVTTQNVIIAYNAGIKAVVRGYIPRTTKLYLSRYTQLARSS